MTFYPKSFYALRDDQTRQSAVGVLKQVVDLVQPKSAIDIGCGTGTWLSVLKEHGCNPIKGVDFADLPEDDLEISRNEYIVHDLTKPLKERVSFDMALCLEVAEHIPSSFVDTLVDSLVGASPVVVFSAAVPGQGGMNHVNEQWPDYWSEKFSHRGYVALDVIRPRIWNNKSVFYWYRQNTIMFVDGNHSVLNLIKNRAGRRDDVLSIVHPEAFAKKTAEFDRSRRESGISALANRVQRFLSRSKYE